MLLQLTPKELDAVSSFWYLKFGTHWAGPFSYIETLQMLKTRRINRNIKIRSGSSADDNGGEWKFISELQEFSSEFIESFCRYYVPKGRSFDLIRRFVRIKYSADVMIVSESGRVMTVECTELSAGGAKVKVPSDFLEEGESLTVQFFYNKKIKLKSFKSKAKVLRLSEIQFSDENNDEVFEVYSIEFEGLKPRYKRMLLKSTQMKIRGLSAYLRNQEKKVVEILDLNEFSERYPHLMLSP